MGVTKLLKWRKSSKKDCHRPLEYHSSYRAPSRCSAISSVMLLSVSGLCTNASFITWYIVGAQ